MQPYDIEKQKPAVQVFLELTEIRDLLWQERDNEALARGIHQSVDKDLCCSADVCPVQLDALWKLPDFSFRIHNALLNEMTRRRDLYGYFPDYKELVNQFDIIICECVRRDEYEIAAIVYKWRQKLPDP
jgi:hypothetical protein